MKELNKNEKAKKPAKEGFKKDVNKEKRAPAKDIETDRPNRRQS